MKRMSFVTRWTKVATSATLPLRTRRSASLPLLMLVAMSATAATVSVSSFKGTVYGPGEATLAFSGVSAAQEVWVAWDDADKGADITQWKESERLDTIASGTTSASYRLPADARAGRAARFFLFPSGGTYPTAYIRSTGRPGERNDIHGALVRR